MELSIIFSLLTSINGMIEDSDEKDIDLKDFFCIWWNPSYDVQVYREGLNYSLIFKNYQVL